VIAADLDYEAIEDFCCRRPIDRLALFGSVLRQDFGPDSDVDFLVHFTPGATVGLFDIADMEIELSRIIGRKADMRTPKDLSRYFRDEVLQSARVIYERS